MDESPVDGWWRGTNGNRNDGASTSAAHAHGACAHHGGLAECWG